MTELKDAKEIYEGIEIPKELNEMVTDSISNYVKKASPIPMNNRKKNTCPIIKHTMVAAAAVLICFMIVLNSSETIAQAMSHLPVLGSLARVLTIRSYQTSDDNMNISVNVPEIVSDNSQNEMKSQAGIDIGKDIAVDNAGAIIEEDTNQYITDMNEEIDKIVNDYLADAKSRMQADKDAFIATGGTEEDWANRDLNINVNYEVKYQQESLLSFILSADESWYNAYDMKYFYNLDLKDNRELTLKDILGDDYIKIANDSIIKQMKERAAKDANVVYWGITDNSKSDIDGFTTVDEHTIFYLNEDGKPVVYFEKYEIAPGFMGAQEFVVE
jgi:hypothetical protein